MEKSKKWYNPINITGWGTLTIAITALLTATLSICSTKKQIESVKLQVNSIKLQERADSLQWLSYKKTIRPFVYVDKLFLDQVQPNQDVFNLYYTLKNVGNLPAKNVRQILKIINNGDIIMVIGGELKAPFTDLYPGDSTQVLSEYRNMKMENFVNLMVNTPFIHIHVQYEDLDGEKHSYRTVKEYIPNRGFINRVSDFD